MGQQVEAEGESKDAPPAAMPTLRRELSIQDQSSRMSLRKILVVYFGLGLALIVSFSDQTSVATAAPTISSDLGGSRTQSWIGAAFFVSNCAFQLIYGRMSDIFGRKAVLQAALLLMALGNLLCSFAKTPIQLYIFRAISGAGGGGVNSTAMVVISDIIPLKERGKYQGLLSASTSFGNAVGLFMGGGLASVGQWRWLFRITAILGLLIAGFTQFIIPLKPVTGSMKKKFLQIDYFGVALSTTAIVLLLVPISGGGSTFAWNSPTVISLLCLGCAFAVAFVWSQWKWARLPILPLRLFRIRTPRIVMVHTFFIGMIYYGNIFYVPIYLQYVKGYSPLVSGAFVLAWTFPQALGGIVGGFYISRTNHYKRVIILGACLWTLGLALQVIWKEDTNIGAIIGMLEINAIGISFSLQTTLVACLATTENKDRAVVTGGRNFFRTMGSAFGLAISNAVYQSVLSKHLASIAGLSANQRVALIDQASTQLATLSPELLLAVRSAYAGALRIVFATFAAMGSVCIVCGLFIEEVEFRKDSPELIAEKRRAKGLPDPEIAPEPAAAIVVGDVVAPPLVPTDCHIDQTKSRQE